VNRLPHPTKLYRTLQPYLEGTNFDLARKAGPYLINTKGMGTMMSATQPITIHPREQISYRSSLQHNSKAWTYPTKYWPIEDSWLRTSASRTKGKQLQRWIDRQCSLREQMQRQRGRYPQPARSHKRYRSAWLNFGKSCLRAGRNARS
jgi:hypothetical protein